MTIQYINPLLFCPSPRSIPEVIQAWEVIPYDKLIVKNKPEDIAYKEGRKYFLENEQYTHLIICPDDLVLYYNSFFTLLFDVLDYGYSNLSGISNIDESQLDVYCCKPLGVDPTKKSKGSFYTKDTIPEDNIFEVGFTGFSCQFIDRELMEDLTFTGGCNNGSGCMDLQFTKECINLAVPQLVDKRAIFYHMRMAEYHQVRAWKNKAKGHERKSYTILLKSGERLINIKSYVK